MLDLVVRALVSFFTLALAAVTIQNAVLARALGVSRLLSLVDDTTDTLIFGILLTGVTVLSNILHFIADRLWLRNFRYSDHVRPLVLVVCMSVAFFAVLMLAVKFAPYGYVEKAASVLPSATFNCLVIGTLLLTSTKGLSALAGIGFGIGSGVGYVLAVLLVTEGEKKLQNSEMPAAFKGLPATLLYLAGLALAVYGLTGYSFSF